MGVSNKYRTFDQLLEDVSIDFSSLFIRRNDRNLNN